MELPPHVAVRIVDAHHGPHPCTPFDVLDCFEGVAGARTQRGWIVAAQHNDPQALDDYTRALELDEVFIPVYNNRGLLYTRQGNFALAIADFTVAVTLDPVYAPGYHNRALVHAIEGNYDLAMADLQDAIALDPAFAAPHAALAAAYSALAAESYATYDG